MTAQQDGILVQRRRLMDRAHELDSVLEGPSVSAAMRHKVMAAAASDLWAHCDWLWHIAQRQSIQIVGDLIVADRCAAVQQRWNEGDVGGAIDALLEAYGHMRAIQVDLAGKEGAA